MANKKRYNTLGALNNIIMVYPSAKSFDTWFVGPDRDNAESKLVAGVQAMIDRVTGGGSQPPNQCQDAIQAAEASLDSIECYLAGDQGCTTFVEFDKSSLEGCNTSALEQKQADVIDSEDFKVFQFDNLFWS